MIPGSGADPERLGDRRADEPLVGQRRELHPPGAVGEAIQGLGGGLDGEPGLAAAPGAGQGDEAMV